MLFLTIYYNILQMLREAKKQPFFVNKTMQCNVIQKFDLMLWNMSITNILLNYLKEKVIIVDRATI